MVRDSFPGTGQGLFAVRAIPADTFVLEYTGERIPTGSAENGGSRYLFLIDDDWTIDGTVPGNIAGYVNHACMPNCEARMEEGEDGQKHIMFYTLRDIFSGEELTIDYGPDYFKKFIEPVGCRCSVCINPN